MLTISTTAAAMAGISTAGRVLETPEKHRRPVHFGDGVAKQEKLGKKTKMTHNPTQGPKIRHVNGSKARIAALSTVARKEGAW